jgi:hypothetical protein
MRRRRGPEASSITLSVSAPDQETCKAPPEPGLPAAALRAHIA